MDIGKRIMELREKKGITTNKLANIAGVSQSHLRDIELGNKGVTVETLSYFCDALGISMKEFFDESETKINPFLLSALEKLSDEQQIKLAVFLNSLK